MRLTPMMSLFAALALLGVAAGCGGGSSDADEAAVEAPSELSAGAGELSGKEVKLGLLTGLTGEYSSFADAVVNGSKIAIEDINKMGGVLGRPVSLIVQDNKSTPQGAVSGFEKLVQVNNVVAIGGVESTGGVAVLERAAKQQVPTICSFCGTPVLDTKGGNYMWRPTASDTVGGVIAAQFARDRGYDKVAILAEKGEVGRPAMVFKDVFENKVGGEVTNVVRFDPGNATYQVELQQAFSGNPDAVYLAGGHQAGNAIFKEWQRRGYGGKFFVSPDLITPSTTFDFIEGGVATGAIAAFDESTKAYRHFAKRLEDETGKAPSEGLGQPLYYDTFISLALAIQAAGNTDGAAVEKGLGEILNPPGKRCYIYKECVSLLKDGEEIDYHGASTNLNMNENGNLEEPVMGKIQLKDGKWIQVETVKLDSGLLP